MSERQLIVTECRGTLVCDGEDVCVIAASLLHLREQRAEFDGEGMLPLASTRQSVGRAGALAAAGCRPWAALDLDDA